MVAFWNRALHSQLKCWVVHSQRQQLRLNTAAAAAATTTVSMFCSIHTLLLSTHFCPLKKNYVPNSRGFSSKENLFLRGFQFSINQFFGIISRHFPRSKAGGVVSLSCVLQLTEENVERVLDEVRLGLMADGGNVALHEIDDLVVVLKLQGACESCLSSAMTLKMRIETRLHDKIPKIMEAEQIMDTETGLELTEENVDSV